MENSKSEKNKISSVHESPLVMLISSSILAVGAIFSGYLFKDLFIGRDNITTFGMTQFYF